MNELVESAGSSPAFILLFLWWAFLSVLEFAIKASEASDQTMRPAVRSDDAEPDADATGFPEILRADPSFDPQAFLAGARLAYEQILRAYAAGDLRMLRSLLSAEVFTAFAEACAGREKRRETLELIVIGVQSAEIVHAQHCAGAIETIVLLRAQIVTVERSASGDVIAGDPRTIVMTNDLWTFSRPIAARNDTWLVVATDEAERIAA